MASPQPARTQFPLTRRRLLRIGVAVALSVIYYDEIVGPSVSVLSKKNHARKERPPPYRPGIHFHPAVRRVELYEDGRPHV